MMYATGWKYNSAGRLARTAVLLVVLGAVASAQSGPLWRERPDLLALFAPRGPRATAYRAFVSTADLATVLHELESDPALPHGPGAWRPRTVSPTDAFGRAGPYDRWGLARLYGPERARVARGVRVERDRIVESWTLISPFPDPTLRRLERGTLLIVLALP
jgi:hypothetical protein